MKKLYRSRTDSKLFGLCGGLAELLNVDSTLLRVVLLVTTFFTGGTLIPIYFISCLVIPKEPAFDSYYDPNYGYSNKQGYGPYSSNPGPTHTYYGGGPTGTHQPYGNGAGSYSAGYGTNTPPYGNGGMPPHGRGPTAASNGPSIDEMMKDVEKKALQKEIDELRAKLARLEKDDKQS
ncbi:PspC domain-containing protein [Paenibacillus hodogayensis]|uniref:PspC domain-containing protein n=1 Tax=Paenibacillus hodogayensis TaxID=279208 RepID=A0ABV5W7G6_9BACL